MDNKIMYVTGVIDTELWNQANWMGTAVLSDKKSAPYLGLLFKNKNAAIKIFENWNATFGHRDIYEEIRIAIIEGDIPGKEHGYTVHITTNQDNLISKCKKLGVLESQVLFTIISRVRRIPTEKGNRNIIVFTGPNNSGKSQVLKDIEVYMNPSNRKDTIVIKKIEYYFQGDIDETDFLKERFLKDNQGQYRIFESEHLFDKGAIKNLWNDHKLYNELYKLFVKRLSTETRLISSNALNRFNHPEKHPIYKLNQSEELAQKLSGYFR